MTTKQYENISRNEEKKKKKSSPYHCNNQKKEKKKKKTTESAGSLQLSVTSKSASRAKEMLYTKQSEPGTEEGRGSCAVPSNADG